MDTAIWIAQALLAAIFITTGTVKLTQSRAKLAAGPMRWAAVGAIVTHAGLGETERIAAPALVLVLALFVGVGIPGH